MYLGGFYLDQLLRDPEHTVEKAAEEQFVRELRKYTALAGPTDGAGAGAFDFDDKR
jgi:hypothetical protein